MEVEQGGAGDAADEKQEETGYFNDEEHLRDAKTIFIYNIIKKKHPSVTVLTELIT